jgi:transcriptional regulator with XRE-family HTH domain
MPKPEPNPRPPWPPDADHAFVASFLVILKQAREDQGLSLRELAAKTGIDHGIIGRGERMERIPSIVTMRRWVRGLGLDWHQVYKEAENAGL